MDIDFTLSINVFIWILLWFLIELYQRNFCDATLADGILKMELSLEFASSNMSNSNLKNLLNWNDLWQKTCTKRQ